MRVTFGETLFLVLCAVASASSANAQSLTFTRIDVADVTPGEDLWLNTYTFSGALEEFGGLTLIYNPAQFSQLGVGPVAPEFTVNITPPDPDPLVGADGLVTLTSASAQPASYMTSFSVSYVKLATLDDGHPYEIFDASFNTIGGGTATLAPVPEPSSAALLLGGTFLMAARYRRTKPSAR